jgi:hypothetical protein
VDILLASVVLTRERSRSKTPPSLSLSLFLSRSQQISFLQVAVPDVQFGPMRFHQDQLQVLAHHDAHVCCSCKGRVKLRHMNSPVLGSVVESALKFLNLTVTGLIAT